VTGDFSASGIGERLADAASRAGWERPTPLQAAAFPVLGRGGNLVLHASSGAGVTGAFGLPLIDRLLGGTEPVEGLPSALVLAATPESADGIARALAGLAAGTGLAVRRIGAGWSLASADVVVATTAEALGEVHGSVLKLEGIRVIVVADLSDQLVLGAGEGLVTLTGLVSRDAQRVVTTARLDDAAEHFIEAHARRPFMVPPRPADGAALPAREPVGQIGYVVVRPAEKAEALARLVEGVDGDVVVRVRTAARAESVRAELDLRGAGPADGRQLRVAGFGDDAADAERVVSYDVPFSAEDLQRFHASGGTVFVEPAQLAHFRRIAGAVPFTLKLRSMKAPQSTGLDAFRASVEAALDGEDLAAQLLVLEPLFERASAAEVAAALSALLRRRVPPTQEQPPSPAGPPPREASTSAFARLFVSIGTRDNVRAGDLVGAITGEAGIKGEQVGRVDIRDTFSVVEVAAGVADRVIKALNGTTMRGRSLRVDYDRKGAGGDSAPRPGGPPRRQGGPPRGSGGPGGPPRRRPPQR
jgi:ATP-dependent RNA helicase DeaD